MYLRHHVLAIDQDGRILRGAQRGVQDGAFFGDVDLVALEHGVDARAKAAFVGELQEELERFVGDAVFGVVEEDAEGFQTQALAALRILGEELAQVQRLHLGEVGFEGLPGGFLTERAHGFHPRTDYKHRDWRAGRRKPPEDQGTHFVVMQFPLARYPVPPGAYATRLATNFCLTLGRPR